MLAGAQQDCPVFLGGEAKRRDTRSFFRVSAVAERLKKREKKRVEDTNLKLTFISLKMTGCMCRRRMAVGDHCG